ncbi:MAG: hypothetical protein LAN71_16550, partial [Acidobacteriia bacterium]|nr:hypothetical protein [Terriglobia bacterium]
MKSDLAGQPENGSGRGHAPLARLDDDDQCVDRPCRPSTQMLDPGLHVHDHGLVPVEQDLREEAAEKDILRAGAALAP